MTEPIVTRRAAKKVEMSEVIAKAMIRLPESMFGKVSMRVLGTTIRVEVKKS